MKFKVGDRVRRDERLAVCEIKYIGKNKSFLEIIETGDEFERLNSELQSYQLVKPEPKCLGEVVYILHENGSMRTVIKGSRDCKLLRLQHDCKEVEIKDGKIYEVESED